jgi:hypothetical protein
MAALLSASKGLSMPITTVPGLIWARSSALGARTLRITSAAQTSAACRLRTGGHIGLVGRRLPPAPACTITWCLAASFLTVPGVAATGFSRPRLGRYAYSHGASK